MNSSVTNSNLRQSYNDYINCNTHLEHLYRLIVDFDDFENYNQYFVEATRKNFSVSKLFTNGSTGNPKQYNFSEFEFWRPRIERFLRSYEGFTPIHIFDRPFLPKNSLSKSLSDGCEVYHLSMASPTQVDELFDHINKAAGQISIITTPNVWLHITSSPSLSDRFNQCQKIVQGVNTDWDKIGLFQNLRFPVKDQMIDWYTGLNFYTCDSGQKHILPIFQQTSDGCHNLLNLICDKHQCDDHFEIKEFVRCECGRLRPTFDFRSHKKNWLEINHELIHQLKDTYINLQFFLIEDRIHIFRICHGSATDTDLIRSVYKDCVIKENSVAKVGMKSYNFWNATDSPWSASKITTKQIKFI